MPAEEMTPIGCERCPRAAALSRRVRDLEEALAHATAVHVEATDLWRSLALEAIARDW